MAVFTLKRPTSNPYIGIAVAAVVIGGVLFSFFMTSSRSPYETSATASKGFYGASSSPSPLPLEGTGFAPGGALTGELVANPATDKGFVGSSLYGAESAAAQAAPAPGSPEERAARAQQRAQNRAARAGSRGGSQAAVSAGSSGGSARPTATGPMPKLQKMSAIGSSAGGTSSGGTLRSGDMLGSANKKMVADSKPDYAMNLPSGSKDGKGLSSLKKTEAFGNMAAGSQATGFSKNAAAAVFDKLDMQKASTADSFDHSNADGTKLDTDVEGMVKDLKASDANLNKSEFTPPSVSSDSIKKTQEDEFTKQLIQMMMQSMMSPIFGAIGQGVATSIFPSYTPQSSVTPPSGGK